MTRGNSLPSGWALARLEELVSASGITNDGDWIESKDQDPHGEVRLIQLADVGEGMFLDKSSRFLTKTKAETLNCTYLHPGDVLISRLGDPLGKTCTFPSLAQEAVTAVDVHIFRSGTEDIDHSWLVHALNSPRIRQAIEVQSSGTTRNRITGKKLKNLVLPIPPRNEQRRITSRIDQLFSDIEEGEHALKRVQVLVERYRQSVLKAAVTGELTREWREQHKGELESGEALLQRILHARREAWEKAELEKMAAKGQTPKNDDWKRKYKEPQPPDTTDLPDLPEGWVWASMDQLLSRIEAGKNFRCEERPPNADEWGVVKVSAVTWGTFDEDESKTITDAERVNREYSIKPGDGCGLDAMCFRGVCCNLL